MDIVLCDSKKYAEAIVDDKGVVHVPKGYRWCIECDALTPHEKDKWHYTCIVCGEVAYHSYECPNCHCPLSEKEQQEPTNLIVVAHQSGCHCDPKTALVVDNMDGELHFVEEHEIILNEYHPLYHFDNWADYITVAWAKNNVKHPHYYLRAVNKYKAECSCPKHTIYRNLNVFGLWSRSYHSMDCSNAIAFGSSVRCKVCGEIWSWEDTNC